MDIDLVKVFQACKKPCFGCQKRRAKLYQVYHIARTWIVIWPLFLFSPWRWHWVYLFCSAIQNWRLQSIHHAIIWSYWCKTAYPGKSAKATVIEYLDLFHSLKNPDTQVALQKAIGNIKSLDYSESLIMDDLGDLNETDYALANFFLGCMVVISVALFMLCVWLL